MEEGTTEGITEVTSALIRSDILKDETGKHPRLSPSHTHTTSKAGLFLSFTEIGTSKFLIFIKP